MIMYRTVVAIVFIFCITGVCAALSDEEICILTSLGANTTYSSHILYDSAAHLDYDWQYTFEEYYNTADISNGKYPVKTILNSVVSILNPILPIVTQYRYSIAEVGFFRRYLQDYPLNEAIFQAHCQNLTKLEIYFYGAGLVSPDTLVPQGEAIIRNYLLGKEWLLANGYENCSNFFPMKTSWLPDNFGLDPELPVLLTAMSLTNLGFSRLPGVAPGSFYSPYSNVQPLADLLTNGVDFWWQASDGSRILAHYSPGGSGTPGYVIGACPSSLSTEYNCMPTVANIASYIALNSLNGSAHNLTGIKTPYIYIPNDADFATPNAQLQQGISAVQSNFTKNGTYIIQAPFGILMDLIRANDKQTHVLQTKQYKSMPYWTGFYGTRTILKVLHRRATADLLAAEILGLLAAIDSQPFWDSVTSVWDTVAISTHHDYVVGTSVDTVYQTEQYSMGLLPASNNATALKNEALTNLSSIVNSTVNGNEIPFIIVNTLGFARQNIFTKLSFDVTSLYNGIRFANTNQIVTFQTNNSQILFRTPSLPSLGYTVAYLTTLQGVGDQVSNVTITSHSGIYNFTNGIISFVVNSNAPCNGISSISYASTSSKQAQILSNTTCSNNLLFYADSGNLYQFGNEEKNVRFQVLTPKNITTNCNVTESGPIRAKITCSTYVKIVDGTRTYTGSYQRNYSLVAGEQIVRMSVNGSAPPGGYDVFTQFSLIGTIDNMVHGTSYHWTTTQPYVYYNAPVFRATHDFVNANQANNTLGVIYHQDVVAWSYINSSLIGCLYRNTPGGGRGASGSDFYPALLHYAFRVPHNISDPSRGQALRESREYTTRPDTNIITTPGNSTGKLQYSLASVQGNGIITAAKPLGPTNAAAGTPYILRLYQPSNTYQVLNVTLGSCGNVTAVDALERDIIAQQIYPNIAPSVFSAESFFLTNVSSALTTYRVVPTNCLSKTNLKNCLSLERRTHF